MARPTRLCCLLLACAPAVVGLASCQNQEDIRAYQAPKPEPRTAPKAEARADKFRYTTPEGWKPVPSKGSLRTEASFQAPDGDKSADVTVTTLSGTGGGLLLNVNRWRTQVKLSEITDAEMRKDLQKIEVDGSPGYGVDLAGPESANAPRLGTLGVIVPRGGQTWFFKMMGPADVVAKQKPAFEAFVRSVQFAERPGANP